ncbi:putative mediator of RNA polymerase II transcription subunit 26 [Zerene cesonia]|uniref:putative mediator of RNA polymerase II transcription subunit 26 n=1 Tax=Zerene cesonia TaxID=33412 RepID=UPI0018E59DBB|nr:putative mediator of RNA polymerase II transcription subunit 26 [Zerene cesonia]
MKELLVVVSLVLSGVVCEAPAPYPPSGWRPSGPSFELPQRPIKQEYLPVDPRRPAVNPNFDDGVDVSVQGLPTQEQQQLFQLSPVNGQQYNGPSINSDIKNLEPSLQRLQYQQQLQTAQQFARQREFDARVKTPANGLPNQQSPRQFASESTTTSEKPNFKSNAEPTTESFDLNQEEQLDNPKDKKEKVSVEVTKQNVQEYPPELFLSPLTQLNVQPQYVPLQQLGQLRAPLYYQPIQAAPESQGFDGPAHLAALPSVLAQRQLLEQQAAAVQNPSFSQSPIIVQQDPALLQEQVNQYQPIVSQYQPQVQSYPQFPAQPVVLQPQGVNQVQANQFVQPGQYQPQFQANPQVPQQEADAETIQTDQPQMQVQAYPQYQQPALLQPVNQIQPNYIQPNQFVQSQYAPANVYAQPDPFAQNAFGQPQQNFIQPQPNAFPQAQFGAQQFVPAQANQPEQDVENIQQQPQIVFQNYQPQVYQPSQDPQAIAPNGVQYFLQSPNQGQVALQSGLNDQQDNGLENEEDDEGTKATAVATAFGARTQPRVFASYGAPVPAYQTTTEAAQEENATEDGPAIAQATAVATGRRKSAKLRNRRVRPVFTLDKSGHLVLAQDQ